MFDNLNQNENWQVIFSVLMVALFYQLVPMSTPGVDMGAF